VNVYMIRERIGNNFFTKNKRWSTKQKSAKVFEELAEARRVRKLCKDNNNISASKIDIIEYELVERKSL